MYVVYLGLGMVFYALLALVRRDSSTLLFVVFAGVIISFYGGGFATIPAYLQGPVRQLPGRSHPRSSADRLVGGRRGGTAHHQRLPRRRGHPGRAHRGRLPAGPAHDGRRAGRRLRGQPAGASGRGEAPGGRGRRRRLRRRAERHRPRGRRDSRKPALAAASPGSWSAARCSTAWWRRSARPPPSSAETRFGLPRAMRQARGEVMTSRPERPKGGSVSQQHLLDDLEWRGLHRALHRPRRPARGDGRRPGAVLRGLRPDGAEPAHGQPRAAR